MENWKKVWNKQKDVSIFGNLLESLVRANGFDTGFGDYTSSQWKIMTSRLVADLGIDSDSSVLEVGCGAGALLYGIKISSGASVFGYDYSESLIKLAKKLVDGEFIISEANLNPFCNRKFDFVISHSVFQYFPNLQYAENVLLTMAASLKPGGKIALLDINDSAVEKNYHNQRRESYSEPSEYDEKYRDHPHLFYDKAALESKLNELGFRDLAYLKHAVPDYGNSKYRFNLIATKI